MNSITSMTIRWRFTFIF